MRNFSALCSGAFLLLFLGVSQGSAASCYAVPHNLVTNCGFELGSFSGWTLSGNDVPGQAGVLYGVEGVDPIDSIGPNSGSYQAFFADLASNPTKISQTLATTAGTAYQITFDLAQDTAPTAGYPNSLAVVFGGTTVDSVSDVPVEGYTQYTFYGVATSASTVFSISLGNGLGEFLLDDVSVTLAPEPASVALLLSGGLLIDGLVRRRRAV